MIQRLQGYRGKSHNISIGNDKIQKFRFLRIYRRADESNIEDCETRFNLQEILEKSQNFLNDKVFEIDIDDQENAPDFKYVTLRVKNISNNRKLI